ncbi:hypothetical protein A9Q88_08355 [Gammaproteobacteria bacterium 50_400_T64]|nr:hypothetical protein A9Q88_08355 [Gammaproteobacteria bacterium 50_400_T64]
MQHSFLCVALALIISFSTLADEQKSAEVKAGWGSDFMLANLEFTLLHEFGHLLIEEFKLPVLGMEEDAADRIAIIIMMRAHQHESAKKAIPWLLSVAGGWYTEWELKGAAQEKVDYWDNHHLDIQRFHNIVCLVFGGNADFLESLMDTEFLPFERAMSCEYEYKQALYAVNWLQTTYGKKSISELKVDAVKVVYEKPRKEQNKKIFELLQTSLVAEKWAQRLSSHFKFPRPISIEFESCVSGPDAYWHAPTASVTICYELLEHFFTMAEYRRQHSVRACSVPILRKYMGDRLGCS